jgi:hypothetical protein
MLIAEPSKKWEMVATFVAIVLVVTGLSSMTLESWSNQTKTLVVAGFADSSSDLTPEMRQKIRKFIRKNSHFKQVTCVGFADKFGSSVSNLRFGESRAKAGCKFALKRNPDLRLVSAKGKWDQSQAGSSIRRVRITLSNSANASFSTSFAFQGGHGYLTSEKVKVGESFHLPEAFKDGHYFLGWFTKPNGGKFVGYPGYVFVPDGNKTIYAHWAKKSISKPTSGGGSGGWPNTEDEDDSDVEPGDENEEDNEPEVDPIPLSSMSFSLNMKDGATADYISNCTNLSLEIEVVSGDVTKSVDQDLGSTCEVSSVTLNDLEGLFVGDEVEIIATVSPDLEVSPGTGYELSSGSLSKTVTLQEETSVSVTGKILKPIAVHYDRNGWTDHIALYACAPAVLGSVCSSGTLISNSAPVTVRYNPYQWSATGSFSFGVGIKQVPDNSAFVPGYKVGPGTGLTCWTSRSNVNPIVGNDVSPPLASDFTSSGVRNVWFSGCQLTPGTKSANFWHIQGPAS